MLRLALLAACLALAACGPMPLAQAEQACIETARLAQQPRGTLGLVASNRGAGAFGSLTVSSDYLQGRDPDEVFGACVRARAGQSPSRPFSSLPQSRM